MEASGGEEEDPLGPHARAQAWHAHPLASLIFLCFASHENLSFAEVVSHQNWGAEICVPSSVRCVPSKFGKKKNCVPSVTSSVRCVPSKVGKKKLCPFSHFIRQMCPLRSSDLSDVSLEKFGTKSQMCPLSASDMSLQR